MMAWELTYYKVNKSPEGWQNWSTWTQAILEGAAFATFNLAHYILAVNYDEIATQVPAMLEGEPEVKQSKTRKVFYWVLKISCVLSGASYTVAEAAFYTTYNQSGSATSVETIFKMLTMSWCLVCCICTGVVLVWGVLKIRRYFKDHNAIEQINTCVLTR